METLDDKIKRFLSYGSGSGYGSGDGSGDGDGSGSGSGSGYGYGYGYGFGDGIKTFEEHIVYMIDGIATIINQVVGNLAKGFILGDDLTLMPCYVAKGQNLFAHGETAKKAEEALREKIFANMDTDQAIEMFLGEFTPGKKYPAKDFYMWHNRLTGSCEFGRNKFVREHGIDLENGIYTVDEFIEITKNDFGGEVIRQLEEKLRQ